MSTLHVYTLRAQEIRYVMVMECIIATSNGVRVCDCEYVRLKYDKRAFSLVCYSEIISMNSGLSELNSVI